MNRPRLQILADHLRCLPDERVDMRVVVGKDGRWFHDGQTVPAVLKECGTAACVAGWANFLFRPHTKNAHAHHARMALGLTAEQEDALFLPRGFRVEGRYTRSDAIAAIQSMLDSPDDDALPVWPSREGASA